MNEENKHDEENIEQPNDLRHKKLIQFVVRVGGGILLGFMAGKIFGSWIKSLSNLGG